MKRKTIARMLFWVCFGAGIGWILGLKNSYDGSVPLEPILGGAAMGAVMAMIFERRSKQPREVP